MKNLLSVVTTVLFCVFFALPAVPQNTYQDVVTLKAGNVVRGTIIERSADQSVKIQTVDNNIFVFSMDEIEKITREPKPVVYAKKAAPADNRKSYTEVYFFGGFSSKKKVMSGTLWINDGYYQKEVPYDIVYKNGGLGGMGVAGLFIGKNRRPDFGLDLEFSLYGAKMITTTYSPDVEVVMSGFVLCLDMHFTFFPIKARNKYPSPFIFTGIGTRIVKLSYGGTSVSEIHGEIPFGIGLRQKVSRVVSFLIEERFVYSKLKEVNGFILPETRFTFILSM